MTYQELLLQDKWKDKREDILFRDRKVCQVCKNSIYDNLYSFEILKKYYISSEYDFLKSDLGNNYYLPLNSIKKSDAYKGFIFAKDNHKKIIIALEGIETKEYEYLLYQNRAERANEGLNELGKTLKVTAELICHRAWIEKKGLGEFSLHPDEFDEYHEKYHLRKRKWLYVKNLHIHHKYYQKGKLPWEYPDEALVTLCWSCHEHLHSVEKVPYYDESMNLISSLTPCDRCFSAGEFPEYHHVQNGICFKCGGAKYMEFIKEN